MWQFLTLRAAMRWYGLVRGYASTRSHATPTGLCEHELYVDDGSLYTVDIDPWEGYLIKTVTAKCVSSTARRQDDGGCGSTEVWQMRCPQGAWQLTTEWNPSKERYTATDPRSDRAPANMALTDLRPVSRSDIDAFGEIANHRNNSESFNNWYKTSLPISGCANSYSLPGQEFDFLTGAYLQNAVTWRNAEEEDFRVPARLGTGSPDAPRSTGKPSLGSRWHCLSVRRSAPVCRVRLAR